MVSKCVYPRKFHKAKIVTNQKSEYSPLGYNGETLVGTLLKVLLLNGWKKNLIVNVFFLPIVNPGTQNKGGVIKIIFFFTDVIV